jgi:hypothetical protein
MDIQVLLKMLESFESAVAKHYRRLAEGYASDRDASFLFYKMYLEEKAHASLVRYERRLIRNAPDLFGPATADLTELENVTAYVNALMDRANLQPLDEAVRSAAEIENSASEYHYRTAIVEAYPAVARLLRGLGTADREHVGALWEFGVQRGFLSEEARPPFVGRREETAEVSGNKVASSLP